MEVRIFLYPTSDVVDVPLPTLGPDNVIGIANSVTLPTEFNLTDPQRIAVESLQAGDVFVIDARGETRCGTMGAILATRMAMRGCVGLVTDGCYRDTPEIRSLELASYARAMNAQTNKTLQCATPLLLCSTLRLPTACLVLRWFRQPSV